jgi:hypothetical protein
MQESSPVFCCAHVIDGPGVITCSDDQEGIFIRRDTYHA